MNLPFVTFAIPTYNSGAKLARLLKSIIIQDYPPDKVEILVADGGSEDDTVDIARSYGCKVLKNPKKFAEPGKAVCINNANGDLICFVDDDNELPSKDWLNRMVKPLANDKEIIATEPIRFEYKKDMSNLDKYWALSGFNDPVFYYMGLYDKWNFVSNRWNGIELEEEDKGDYIKFKIDNLSKLITLGANGFIVRQEVIKKIDYHNLLDIDKVAAMIETGFNTFAKVKVGIIHYFCSDLRSYIKKAKRKAKNIISPSHVGVKNGRKVKYPIIGIIKFTLSTITILPLLLYSIKGYFKKRDSAWFTHVIVCWVTLLIYGGVSAIMLLSMRWKTQ